MQWHGDDGDQTREYDERLSPAEGVDELAGERDEDRAGEPGDEGDAEESGGTAYRFGDCDDHRA